MKSTRRFVPVVFLMVLLVLCATPFAAAQDSASVSPALSPRAQALLPAPPARSYAPAAAVPGAAVPTIEPDPSRKWEVEFHGAGTLSFNPTSGTSFLPPIAGGFTAPGGASSLIVPSWYFGVGANLYNTVVANNPAVLSQRIESLDTALTSPVVRRNHGPGFGARISRELNSRFSLEGDVDYNLATLEFHGARLPITNASATWQSSWTQVFTAPNCAACTGTSVTSVATLHDHQGHQLMATGALNVIVLRHGRFIPYLTVGGGAIFSLGDAPSATLVGNYQLSFRGAPIHETDSIRLHYGVPDHVGTGFFGGGVKYYITSHYGIRVEVRDYVSSYHVDNLLDASPTVAIGTPAFAGSESGSPTFVQSNNPSTGFPSSLSAPPLVNFRTLAGGGTLHQVQFTFGFFFRF